MRMHIFALSVTALLLTGCGDDGNVVETPETGELVVRASGSAVAPSIVPDGYAPAVTAASFEIGFSEMRVSANADCSGPYQTIFARSTPTRVDISTNPELARTDGLKRGSYPCVAVRMSDILRYSPVVTDGPCVAGVTTTHDIYREGNEESDWLDIDGGTIAAHGTDSSPAEDLVWSFISTSETAVEARGYGATQVITLSAPLVVPGTTTFYWDLTDALGDEGDGTCGTVAGHVGFR